MLMCVVTLREENDLKHVFIYSPESLLAYLSPETFSFSRGALCSTRLAARASRAAMESPRLRVTLRGPRSPEAWDVRVYLRQKHNVANTLTPIAFFSPGETVCLFGESSRETVTE